jgi:hypothetical protein
MSQQIHQPARPASELTVPAARVEVLPLPGDRATIIGPVDQLAATLGRIRAAGRLVAASDPRPDGRPGLYAVTIRLTPPPRPTAATAATTRQRDKTRQRLAIAGILAAVIALGILAWLAYTALTWIAAHIGVALAAGLLLALALAAAGGGSRVCKTIITVTHRH